MKQEVLQSSRKWLRTIQIRTNQIRTNQVRTNQVRTNQVRKNKVRTNQVRTSRGVHSASEPSRLSRSLQRVRPWRLPPECAPGLRLKPHYEKVRGLRRFLMWTSSPPK